MSVCYVRGYMFIVVLVEDLLCRTTNYLLG